MMMASDLVPPLCKRRQPVNQTKASQGDGDTVPWTGAKAASPATQPRPPTRDRVCPGQATGGQRRAAYPSTPPNRTSPAGRGAVLLGDNVFARLRENSRNAHVAANMVASCGRARRCVCSCSRLDHSASLHHSLFFLLGRRRRSSRARSLKKTPHGDESRRGAASVTRVSCHGTPVTRIVSHACSSVPHGVCVMVSLRVRTC